MSKKHAKIRNTDLEEISKNRYLDESDTKNIFIYAKYKIDLKYNKGFYDAKSDLQKIKEKILSQKSKSKTEYSVSIGWKTSEDKEFEYYGAKVNVKNIECKYDKLKSYLATATVKKITSQKVAVGYYIDIIVACQRIVKK